MADHWGIYIENRVVVTTDTALMLLTGAMYVQEVPVVPR